MNLQPTLSNELVLLRPLEVQDFDALFEVAKDPLIWEQHPCPDRYLSEPFATFFEDSLESGGALVVMDQAQQVIIGSSRFKPILGAPLAVEIGWSFLARAYWGGTYNKAVKHQMMAHAFRFIEDIVFYIGKENIRSQRAVVKLGAELVEGPAYAHLIADKVNDLCFRINRGEWGKR